MIQLIFLFQKLFHASHRFVWIRLDNGRKVLKNLPVNNFLKL